MNALCQSQEHTSFLPHMFLPPSGAPSSCPFLFMLRNSALGTLEGLFLKTGLPQQPPPPPTLVLSTKWFVDSTQMCA